VKRGEEQVQKFSVFERHWHVSGNENFIKGYWYKITTSYSKRFISFKLHCCIRLSADTVLDVYDIGKNISKYARLEVLNVLK